MKVRMEVGAEFDVLTQEELRGELQRARQIHKPIHLADGGQIVLDANGNGTLRMVRVPSGKRLRIYRLLITSPAYSPASGYQSANGWVGLYANPNGALNDLRDYAPSSPGGIMIPAAVTYGFDASPEFQGGQYPTLIFVSGPPSTQVVGYWEGDYFPEAERGF